MKKASVFFGLVLVLSLISVNGLAQTDSDGDGLSDEYELAHGLDPNNGDSDGDGIADGNEIDPNTGASFEAGDGDGINDTPVGGTGDPTEDKAGCTISKLSGTQSGLWFFALLAIPFFFWRRLRRSRLLS